MYRHYPDDPLKELRRIRRRMDRKCSGHGTLGREDVETMLNVEKQLAKMLKEKSCPSTSVH